jgi:hypothetical protein
MCRQRKHSSKARAPAATMAAKTASLSLNRVKQPPEKNGATINKILECGALASVNCNSQCLQGRQDVK